MGGALEQGLVVVIVVVAAVYAVRSILRSARGGGDDHCSDCGLKDQHAGKDPRGGSGRDR
ncbi:MAG: FeoB-associated Cys-rich membrane protein [Steroidobacteraceae bacterium]